MENQKIMMNDDRKSSDGERVLVEKESWIKRNAIPLLTAAGSLAAILIAVGLTYGQVIAAMTNYETELASYRLELAKLDTRIAEVNARVDSHHSDSDRHIDSQKWMLMQDQIKSIKELLQQHSRSTNRGY